MPWIAGTLTWLAVAPPVGVLIGRRIHSRQQATVAGGSLPIATPGQGHAARCAITAGSHRRTAGGAPVSWRCSR